MCCLELVLQLATKFSGEPAELNQMSSRYKLEKVGYSDACVPIYTVQHFTSQDIRFVIALMFIDITIVLFFAASSTAIENCNHLN